MTNQVKNDFSYAEGVLLLVGFVVVSLTFAGFVALVAKYENSVALPMLAIAGIVLLLICLAGITYIFTRLGSGDATQALGLPAGSIQAVIALSLVVLFAILSIFLFSSMKAQPLRSLPGLSAADRDAQLPVLGSTFAGFRADVDGKGATTFTIFVRDPEGEARNDIAKQLLILIGTLMTSAVGFYFGSRATAAGTAAAVGGAPPSQSQATSTQIATIEPAGGIPRGQTTNVKVTGTGFAGATVSFRQGANVLPVAGIAATDTEITCTVTPDATAQLGGYDVAVMVNGAEVVKPAGLTVIT